MIWYQKSDKQPHGKVIGCKELESQKKGSGSEHYSVETNWHAGSLPAPVLSKSKKELSSWGLTVTAGIGQPGTCVHVADVVKSLVFLSSSIRSLSSGIKGFQNIVLKIKKISTYTYRKDEFIFSQTSWLKSRLHCGFIQNQWEFQKCWNLFNYNKPASSS